MLLVPLVLLNQLVANLRGLEIDLPPDVEFTEYLVNALDLVFSDEGSVATVEIAHNLTRLVAT